jgi:GNAT superfamily N-acetyltransferase
MVKRLIPTFSNSLIRWVIAKSIHTGEIVACACWIAPGNPIYGALRKSAVDFYGWRELYNCSDEEFEELWSHVDDEKWSGNFANYDAVRKEVLGDEPHWYLASLFTWPEWQGKGAGKLLLDWAIEQADANDPPTPLYLESAPTARAFYIRYGFVPTGEQNLVRRGPTIEKV